MGVFGSISIEGATTVSNITELYYRPGVQRGFINPLSWYDVPRNILQSHFGLAARDIHYVRICTADQRFLLNKPVQLYIIHGTWAHKGADFHAWDNVFYQGILNFALELSLRVHAPVETISFLWSGANVHADRLQAAKRFTLLCNRFGGPAHGFSASYGFMHSHGTTVYTLASPYINFVLDTLFYLAAPVRKYIITPDNCRVMMHLYADDDLFQYLGGFSKKNEDDLFGEMGMRVFQEYPGRRIINVCLRVDGKSPGHIRLKSAANYLWSLLDGVTENYRFHSSFLANIKSDKFEQQIVIREKISVDKAASLVGETVHPGRFLSALSHELALSDADAARYQALYGRSIHTYPGWISWFWESIQELTEVGKEMMQFYATPKPFRIDELPAIPVYTEL